MVRLFCLEMIMLGESSSKVGSCTCLIPNVPGLAGEQDSLR